MGSVNRAILLGNAGKDGELRYTPSGKAKLEFSLAVNSRGKEGKESTEWFNIVVWDNFAEAIATHITKGKQLYIEGRFQTRSWDDDSGQKHYRTEIVAQTLEFVGSAPGEGSGGGGRPPQGRGGAARGPAPATSHRQRAQQQQQGQPYSPGDLPDDDDDDLPFE